MAGWLDGWLAGVRAGEMMVMMACTIIAVVLQAKYMAEDVEVLPDSLQTAAKNFTSLPFTPNAFQVEMLEGIRTGKSIVACAPTSYGKSFGVYYAAAYTTAC